MNAYQAAAVTCERCGFTLIVTEEALICRVCDSKDAREKPLEANIQAPPPKRSAIPSGAVAVTSSKSPPAKTSPASSPSVVAPPVATPLSTPTAPLPMVIVKKIPSVAFIPGVLLLAIGVGMGAYMSRAGLFTRTPSIEPEVAPPAATVRELPSTPNRSTVPPGGSPPPASQMPPSSEVSASVDPTEDAKNAPGERIPIPDPKPPPLIPTRDGAIPTSDSAEPTSATDSRGPIGGAPIPVEEPTRQSAPSFKMHLTALGTAIESGRHYQRKDSQFSRGPNLMLSVDYDGLEPGQTELAVAWYVGDTPVSLFPIYKIPTRSGRWSREYDNETVDVGEHRIILTVDGHPLEQPMLSFWVDEEPVTPVATTPPDGGKAQATGPQVPFLIIQRTIRR